MQSAEKNVVERPMVNTLNEMRKFKSSRGYSSFSFGMIQENRYVFPKAIDDFLKTVLATSLSRKAEIKKGEIFWRAQHGHAWRAIEQDSIEYEVEAPHPRDRMKPLRHMAREGRINPKGIPCLYLGTDKNTAMAEVRPWLGEYISVAQFKTNKKLSVVNCSIDIKESSIFYFKEPPPKTREKEVWADINRGFSEPVVLDEETANYAPTQILAEAFRENGFDGIVYKSLLGPGLNLALFDIDCADLLNCFLFKTSKLNFEFEEAATPYFRA